MISSSSLAVLLLAQTQLCLSAEYSYQPVLDDFSSLNLESDATWLFQDEYSDEFDTFDTNKWRDSFPNWQGLPPSVYHTKNVNIYKNTLRVRARIDTDLDFNAIETSDEHCSCAYEEYSSGIVMSKYNLGVNPSEMWYFEVSARPMNANIRSNIWLQGHHGEFSAFEISPKDNQGDATSTCGTSFNRFTTDTTESHFSFQSDRCPPTAKSTYGFGWNGKNFITTVNGGNIVTTDLSTHNMDSNFTSGFQLIMDVFVNASDGMPDASDMPGYMLIDYVRVWKGQRISGYTQEVAANACDRTTSKKSSLPKILGQDITIDECAATCNATFDCYFFTLSAAGVCSFYEQCTPESEPSGLVQFTRDLDVNPVPEAQVSAIDGYTVGEADSGCDVNGDSTAAAKTGISGSDRTLEECADACNKQSDCWFFTLSGSGYCRFFNTCNTLAAKTNMQLYSRDKFKLESIEERCDKSALTDNFKSLGGSGHTEQACLDGCEAREDCAFVVFLPLKGYCHMFSGRCDVLAEAKGGSRMYSRVNGAPIAKVDGFEYNTEICDKSDSVNNVRTATYSLGGKGHSFFACNDACEADSTCNFFQHSKTGYCFMYEVCDVTVPSTKLKMYSRVNPAPYMLADLSFSSSSFPHTGAIAGIIALIALIAVAAFVVIRRQSIAKQGYMSLWKSSQADDNEHVNLLSSQEMEYASIVSIPN